MRARRITSKLTLVAAVAAAALLLAPVAQAGASAFTGGNKPAAVASLKITAQKVEVKKKGADAFKAAKDGQELKVGDTVRTDATGQAEIDYDADTYTRLDVNTSFKVTKLTDDQGNRQVEGTVESGQTWNRTTALTESESFEQTGAGATAAVTGTAYAVTCSDSEHCSFTAIVDTFTLTGTDGLQKLLSPLDQCDSTSGALCADITKIDPSQLGDWILQNLILDVARGFPFPDFPVTFQVFVEGGQVFATQPEATGPSGPTGPACGAPSGSSGDSGFDGSPGTGAPPGTLGPYETTPFGDDTRPTGTDVSSVSTPLGGQIGFCSPLNHREVGDGWATWSNGYTGDVYVTPSDAGVQTVTITLPANTIAFYFYAEPNTFSVLTVTATANDGTTSGPVSVDGNGGAQYFGFYSTSVGNPLTSITVSSSDTTGFAIGEFGICRAGDPCEDPPEGGLVASAAPAPSTDAPAPETPPSTDPPPEQPTATTTEP